MFLLAFVVSVFQTADQAPTAEAFLKYTAPKDWRSETIALPPAFAPQMKWQGKEALRFAPGMFRPQDKTFLSYTILMHIKRPVDQITEKEIRRELLSYYRGLASAVAGRDRLDTAGFQLQLKKATRAQQSKKLGKENKTAESFSFGYTAELHWIEPFVTKKTQVLHMEIHGWAVNKEHSIVFVCASPQPNTETIWTQMRSIRKGARKPQVTPRR